MFRSLIGLLIFFSPMILLIALMIYIIINQINKLGKLSYFTELSCDEIASRMALQNMTDNIKFKCTEDDIEKNSFVLSCSDINDDWHFKPGYTVYQMYLEPNESGTYILLFLTKKKYSNRTVAVR